MSTREELLKEANQLIVEITNYSPDAGKNLAQMLKDMGSLCVETTKEDKAAKEKDSGSVIDKETKRAVENLGRIERLKKLYDQGVTVRCGP